jgi:hypothetical protein
LASALVGEVGQIRWPGESLKMAMRSLATWLICFLAGPIIPASMGLAFWLNGGDPILIDWLILVELMLVMFGYWMLAVVAVSRSDRLLDANPIAVAELVARLGTTAMAAVVAIALLSAAQLAGLYVALDQVHGDPAIGWSMLFGCWVSVLITGTYLMRFLGTRDYQRSQEEEVPVSEEVEVEAE